MSFWKRFKKTASSDDTGTLTINAVTYDETSMQIKVDVDWDDQFVKYLKRHGYTGSTDELIVQKYIAEMYRGINEELSAEGRNFE